jgi:quinol-cytochrome oxidoreductase complex cytochrome b subunit
MAGAVPFVGSEGLVQPLLLGARKVGEETLNRFYVLHCLAIPLAAALLMGLHFWRVRKDGGISGPL